MMWSATTSMPGDRDSHAKRRGGSTLVTIQVVGCSFGWAILYLAPRLNDELSSDSMLITVGTHPGQLETAASTGQTDSQGAAIETDVV